MVNRNLKTRRWNLVLALVYLAFVTSLLANLVIVGAVPALPRRARPWRRQSPAKPGICISTNSPGRISMNSSDRPALALMCSLVPWGRV
jgi:hypothetical protein